MAERPSFGTVALSLCAEVGNCTDNDAHGHGTHVAGTVAGHQYGVAKHATIHGMQVIGSDGRGTIIGVLNAMDEVVSSVERQIFQMSIASSAGTMWDTAVNTATNDYDAIGPFALADRASRACLCTKNKPFERPLGNSYWRRCPFHQEVDREWHAW